MGEVGEEGGCVGIAAADGDAVEGGGIVGKDGFAFEAPAAQDGFHAAQVPAVLEEGVGVGWGEGAGGTGTGEGGEGIGFEPAVGEGEGLGEELDIDQSAGAGFKGEGIAAGRGAFTFDAEAHAMDGLAPVGGPGGQRILGLAEVGELLGELDEGLAGGGVAGDPTGAGEGLDFPELGPLAVVILVGAEVVDEQALLAVGAEAGIELKHAALGGASG